MNVDQMVSKVRQLNVFVVAAVLIGLGAVFTLGQQAVDDYRDTRDTVVYQKMVIESMQRDQMSPSSMHTSVSSEDERMRDIFATIGVMTIMQQGGQMPGVSVPDQSKLEHVIGEGKGRNFNSPAAPSTQPGTRSISIPSLDIYIVDSR